MVRIKSILAVALITMAAAFEEGEDMPNGPAGPPELVHNSTSTLEKRQTERAKVFLGSNHELMWISQPQWLHGR
jgi:hypothetical protein